MAKDHPDVVKRGLALKKAGNEIVRLLGGREIHPINVRVGGFYGAVPSTSFAALAEELEVGARSRAGDGAAGWRSFPFPDFERDYEFVALRHPDEYPFNEGRIVSSAGWTSRCASTRSTSWRSRSRTPTRCIHGCAKSAAPTWSARWRATA